MAGSSITLDSQEPLPSVQGKANPEGKILRISFVADDTDGSVPNLALNNTAIKVKGFIVLVGTESGGTAPTSGSLAVITDPDLAADIFQGTVTFTAADRWVSPNPGSGAMPPYINTAVGTYNVSVTGNSVNDATGKIILKVLEYS